MAIATLTVDLVARLGKMEQDLSRATQLAERNAKRIEDAFSAVRGAVTGLFAGITVGTAWQALVSDTAKLGAEISKLSQLSNTTVEDFQLMAYGAKSAGVEQEKLADILKDVNDKFGEFSVTGGGELKDFFETVAKKVGVTADAFKNLSGPQALQLYYDTLQKANVSQQQATFFMEALANDATLLIPMLKDGGAGFKQMADEAQRFGMVMDSKAIAAAKDFENNMHRLDATLQGVRLTIGNELIPTINRLSEEFIIGMRNSNGFWDALRKYGLTNPFKNQAESLKELSDEAQKLEDKISIGRGSDAEKKRLADVQQQINYYKELDAARTKAMGNDLGLSDIDALVKPASGFTPPPKAAKKAKADKSDPLGDWIKDIEAQLKPAEDALKRFRDVQLDAAVSGADLTASQKAFYDLVNSPEWQTISEPWKELIRSEAELASVAEQAAAHQKRLNELLGATESAQLERSRADMQLLADALEAGRITAEQFEEAASKALDLVAEKGKDDFDDLKKSIDGWGKDSAKAIGTALASGKASFQDFGNFANQILADIFSKMIYKNITAPAADALGNVNWGGLFGFADGGVMTPSGPLPLRAYANGGIANTPQLAVFGEGRMNEAFVPLPDGRTIPVTINGQGGKGVVVNVIESPGNGGQVQQSQGAGGVDVITVLVERVKGAVASDIAKSGNIAKLMEQRYGLSPAMGAVR